MTVLPDTLSDMVASLKDDVGLVHQMPFTERGRSGFAANLETVRFIYNAPFLLRLNKILKKL